MKYILLITIFLAFSDTAKSQTNNPYVLIKSMPEVLNIMFPIIDSLVPLKKISTQDLKFLTKKELRELKKISVHARGMKLSKDSMSNYHLFPASTLFEAFQHFDSASAKLFESQSYYLLSMPIYFSNHTKALIRISLIKGYSALYVLERKKDHWKVVKSVVQWM